MVTERGTSNNPLEFTCSQHPLQYIGRKFGNRENEGACGFNSADNCRKPLNRIYTDLSDCESSLYVALCKPLQYSGGVVSFNFRSKADEVLAHNNW
jgi:hypothetical protein